MYFIALVGSGKWPVCYRPLVSLPALKMSPDAPLHTGPANCTELCNTSQYNCTSNCNFAQLHTGSVSCNCTTTVSYNCKTVQYKLQYRAIQEALPCYTQGPPIAQCSATLFSAIALQLHCTAFCTQGTQIALHCNSIDAEHRARKLCCST